MTTTFATSIDAQSFASFLSSPAANIDLDLSHSSLLEVLHQYQSYKRKSSPRYTISALISNVKLLEQVFGVTVMPDKVNDIFNTYFISFLFSKGIQGNTITTYYNQMRAALKWGARHRCPLTSTFDDFHITDHHNTKYALSPDDISYIYHFDIRSLTKTKRIKTRIRATVQVKKPVYKTAGNRHSKIGYESRQVTRTTTAYIDKVVPLYREDHIKTLERVRDQFCLSCNLMQRYSDMCRIEPSCFDAQKTTFQIVQQKTGNKATVHIKDICVDPKMTYEILERYGWRSPYPGNINNYNSVLHELLKLIGGKFTSTMVKSENKVNGEIVTTSKPLCDVIASHAGRRTGITWNVNRGVPEAKIRQASGHQDSRSFCHYIIYNEE